MGSRLSEARRCFSILALIMLLITLFGSHLPWMEITEGSHEHEWTISEVQEDGSTQTDTASFEMDYYFNLLSVESCQTFTSGIYFYFSGQVVCSVLSFSDYDKNTIDIHDWSMYKDSCESAGLTAFVLIIIALALFMFVIMFTTFKNVQRKCCPKAYESQHGRAKCMVPTCAAFAPICCIIAILIYFVQCINNAAGTEVVDDVSRSAVGYTGFWIAMTGTICLAFWWILFTIWFCGKNVAQTDFEAGDFGTRSDSARTKSQKQPIAQDSDDEDENSRMELASHQN